jgi:AI-2 transport protein TqsA
VERIFAQFENWDLKLDQEKIATDLKNQIPSLVTNSVGTVMDFISSTILVSIFVIFLLIGRNPHAVRSGIYGEIDHRIRKYITTKTVISIITGVSVWIILSIFNLELANIFGILAFLLNYIPSIGSIVATVLPIPIAVAQFQNPWLIVAVVGIPGLLQLTMGNVIEPRIMGKELQLHPVTILLALSTWGLIWGVVGMFLAVPITAAIRIVLMQFETLRPVGLILAGQFSEINGKSA